MAATAPTLTALTAAQERALSTFLSCARCLGGRATDPVSGYVHTATAKQLVDLGLLAVEKGATGKDVYTITPDGMAALGYPDAASAAL